MERFARRYWHKSVIGLDSSLASLKQAQLKTHGVYLNADATHLPFKNRSFSLIISNGVIHHIPHYTQALQEISRILKPKGQLYLTIYNHSHPYRLVYNFFGLLRRLPHHNFIINLLAPLYWPIYALMCLIYLHYLPNFSETKSDLADRFFVPYARFFRHREIHRLCRHHNFKILATSTHALGTMTSYLFRKLG